MRLLIFLLITVFTIQVSVSKQLGGAMDGGNGDLMIRDVEPEQIEAIVRSIIEKKTLLFVFRYVESVDDYVMPDSIFEALFTKSDNLMNYGDIYNVVTELSDENLDFSNEGICKDTGHDMTLVVSEGKTIICIDLKGLVGKLTMGNFVKKLVELMAHEVSHIVRLNERQADFIQQIVEFTTYPGQSFALWGVLRDRLMYVEKALSTAIKSATVMADTPEITRHSIEFAEVCNALWEADKHVLTRESLFTFGGIAKTLANSSLSYFGHSRLLLKFNFQYRKTNFKTFCYDEILARTLEAGQNKIKAEGWIVPPGDAAVLVEQLKLFHGMVIQMQKAMLKFNNDYFPSIR